MHRTYESLTRRNFILRATSSVFSLSIARKLAGQTGSASSSKIHGAIHGVRIGAPTTIPHNYGDTWVTAWASDDNLYSPSNDTLCFKVGDWFTKEQLKLYQTDLQSFAKSLTKDEKDQFHYGPIGFNRIEGKDPLSLRGSTVNLMDDYSIQDHYPVMSDLQPSSPTVDGRAWKSSGCAFIHGTFYWVIARHKYPGDTATIGLRQNAVNTSIIKSSDMGRTWTRSAGENLDSPMFPGSHFATPYFVDYGRYNVSVDGADRYVYATSNNGFWDNGDSLILGRVLRSRIGQLNGKDWEFFTGGDGMKDANWTSDAANAQPIIEKPGRLGETGAVYLPDRKRYMLIGWYYPGGSGFLKGSSTKTVWDFYEAPKPWGPWRQVDSHTWSPQGYYCPGVCPKFQSGRRVYVVTAGDFNNWWDFYHLTIVPVDLL